MAQHGGSTAVALFFPIDLVGCLEAGLLAHLCLFLCHLRSRIASRCWGRFEEMGADQSLCLV